MLLPTGFHTFVGFPIFHVQFCLVCSPSVLIGGRMGIIKRFLYYIPEVYLHMHNEYIFHIWNQKVLGIKNENLMLVLELVASL